MFASNQTAALLASVSRILASSPGSSTGSWHYATESWTAGGVLFGVGLLIAALILAGAVASKVRIR
jgi:hypothetical protein